MTILCVCVTIAGAAGVGKTTLQKMLITRFPDRYAYCVPCKSCDITRASCDPCISIVTSRPIKSGETSGQDYHFISREQIEKEINANKFVEYKEVKGFYYGVHMASVSNVLLAGKSPILELQHPQVFIGHLYRWTDTLHKHTDKHTDRQTHYTNTQTDR